MARHCFEAAITTLEAHDLAFTVGYRDFTEPLIAGLVRKVLEVAPITLLEPAYARVEKRPEGHPWHTDAGNKHGGTRGWCAWSAGVLLTPPDQFSGGGLFFRDDSQTPIYHYRDLWVWTGDETHCVTPHSGDRRVLIMFFGEA